MLPKISIITPSYNQGEFIRQTIDSVLAQNYPNFEHIVVDGGSTDNTIAILKSYPHLKWSSEKDRGQTHALNKGFSQATGEIVTWLNSDDWYAPNVFHEVAEKLKTESVVMGACQFTDRDGNPTDLIPNIERNWFDLLKYWIYFASPAQPSIFFKKSALDEVRISSGNFLDEDLFYCMDYELWLRLGAKFSFKNRIDRVVSYFRNYDTNKSGQDMAASYREDSRVFRRHSLLAANSERKISFLIPCSDIAFEFQKTLLSITSQNLRDLEVLVVDYGTNDKKGREVRKIISDLDRDIPQIPIRYVRAETNNLVEAFQKGIYSSCAGLIAMLLPGITISSSFALEASNLFEQDSIGAAFSIGGNTNFMSHFASATEGHFLFKVDSLFQPKTIPMGIVFRKVALLELEGFFTKSLISHAFRELFLRLLYKGWQISVQNSLRADIGADTLQDDSEMLKFGSEISTKLILNLDHEYRSDPFAKVRIPHGFGVIFPEEMVARAREYSGQK